ncbi:MAG: hypothetical protein K2X81_19180 [Candidatus Obscuribacterales bacterium]|nr:hypothetical protein [Candidatus Obscuribacterales bacterium]
MLEHHESFSPEPVSHTSSASDAFRADYFSSTMRKALGSSDVPAAPPSDASAPPAGIDAAGWAQVNQWTAKGTAVNFTTADSGQTPDYILGADGKLTKNPAKTSASADGSITIQVDSAQGQAAAKKAAQQLQVATIQQKIAYWQKGHPNSKDVPDFLKGELATAQNVSTDAPQQQVQPKEQPRQTASDAPPPSNPPPSFNGPGSQSVGDRNIGNGGNRQGSFEPSAPIDRSAVPPPVAGDLNIKGPASCTPDQIQTFLEKMHSPAAQEQGFSKALFDACTQRGIDPAVAVGFFLQESTCGNYGRGHENHSLGNIKGVAPESGGSDGTFRHYNTWAEGARDWARLIDDAYVQKRGLQTLSQVISVYAPGSDNNNERGYVATVKGVVEAFKKQNNGTAVA